MIMNPSLKAAYANLQVSIDRHYIQVSKKDFSPEGVYYTYRTLCNLEAAFWALPESCDVRAHWGHFREWLTLGIMEDFSLRDEMKEAAIKVGGVSLRA
jgi:hypothetical protein